jgi:hypothetical protein
MRIFPTVICIARKYTHLALLSPQTKSIQERTDMQSN